jgi:hypothetical protein
VVFECYAKFSSDRIALYCLIKLDKAYGHKIQRPSTELYILPGCNCNQAVMATVLSVKKSCKIL